MNIAIIALFTLIINILMGIWRAFQAKFSLKWFVAIHAPVPLVVMLRLTLNVSVQYIAIFVLASVAGQIIGSRIIYPKILKRNTNNVIA